MSEFKRGRLPHLPSGTSALTRPNAATPLPRLLADDAVGCLLGGCRARSFAAVGSSAGGLDRNRPTRKYRWRERRPPHLWKCAPPPPHGEQCLALSDVQIVLSVTRVRAQFPGTGQIHANTGRLLQNAVAVSVSGNCAGLSGLIGSTSTLVVLNTEVCRGHGPNALLELLANAQFGEVRALVAIDAPAGDELPPNYALFPTSQTPSFLRNRYAADGSTTSVIVAVTPAWATHLAEHLGSAPGGGSATPTTLRVASTYIPIAQPGFPITGSVATNHLQWFLYQHPSVTGEPLTITVTPSYGNPDLYVRTGPSLTALTLPTPNGAGVNRPMSTQTSPGDDSLTIALDPPLNGAVAIGVFGQAASAFSLIVSAPSTEIRLDSGMPRRFEDSCPVRNQACTLTQHYFSIDVPQSQDLGLSLTTLTQMPPDVYISSRTPGPDAAASEATLSANATVFQHVTLTPAMRAGCTSATSGGALCTVHITVAARSATVFQIVATVGSDATHLLDGIPQAGTISPASGGEETYLVRTASGHSDLTLSLSMFTAHCGAHMYVSTPGGTHTWTSESLSTGDERLVIHQNDVGFCVFCDYTYVTAGTSIRLSPLGPVPSLLPPPAALAPLLAHPEVDRLSPCAPQGACHRGGAGRVPLLGDLLIEQRGHGPREWLTRRRARQPERIRVLQALRHAAVGGRRDCALCVQRRPRLVRLDERASAKRHGE